MSNPPDDSASPKAPTDTPPPLQSELFADADIVYTYTRAQALADGVQVDVSKMAREAGFKCPVFLTDRVWALCVEVPTGVTCQDEEGRTWDILTMLRQAIHNGPPKIARIPFSIHIRNEEGKPASLVTLNAGCSATDIDDPRPAITVMLPWED